ncbi:MarR family winged helix-turn-helix transcriptional regulator [Micromonospora tarensis]|uniref:MarR family winged helix-turn-helix transcriptional regulator n=1 Tax=Micromonospora tarensis TaxID=2806100 RepID=UPI001EE3C401|nr:MarR family winged helix-turn-helix transcriptional regulator [Micromonospora tarensis]
MSATTSRRVTGVHRHMTNRRAASRPESDPVAQLCRTANTVRALLERTVLREADLTWTTYDVLVLVCACDVLEPAAIAAEIGIARATLTNALGLLSDRDLIRRELQEHDLRRTVVRPTRAGLDLAGQLRRRVDAQQSTLFAAPGLPSENDFARALRLLAQRTRPPNGGPHAGGIR